MENQVIVNADEFEKFASQAREAKWAEGNQGGIEIGDWGIEFSPEKLYYKGERVTLCTRDGDNLIFNKVDPTRNISELFAAE